MSDLMPVSSQGQLTGAVVLLSSYLLGYVCVGYYLVRFRTGQDVRKLGSGSVGARNVRRVLGPWGFAATLLGDAAKGALAVWLARHFASDHRIEMLALGAAVAGHIWPAQLQFKGGKGLATAFGALLVFDIVSAVAYWALAGAAHLALRSSVLAGLLAVTLMPAVIAARGADGFTIIAAALIAAVIVCAHRENIAAELAVMRGGCQHGDTEETDIDDE